MCELNNHFFSSMISTIATSLSQFGTGFRVNCVTVRVCPYVHDWSACG